LPPAWPERDVFELEFQGQIHSAGWILVANFSESGRFRAMSNSTSPFTRVLALAALLVIVLNVAAAAMSMEPGVWQRFLPVCVLGGGLYLLFLTIGTVASGSCPIRPSIYWRLAASFAMFVGVFHLLVVLMPAEMWEYTKQAVADAKAANAENAALMVPGVDERTREAMDISGPLSPLLLFILNLALLVVAYLGSQAEDANPEFEPVH